MEKKLNKQIERLRVFINSQRRKITCVSTSISIMMLSVNTVFADSNTGSIDTFLTFMCDWLEKIGGVVAFVGAIMFAVSWARHDAEGKSNALFIVMAGGMVIGIAKTPGLFGMM